MITLNHHEKIEGEDELPTFIFGHSLGGLLALGFTDELSSKIPNLKGVVS